MNGGKQVAEFAESKTTCVISNNNMPPIFDWWFLTIKVLLIYLYINVFDWNNEYIKIANGAARTFKAAVLCAALFEPRLLPLC